MWGQWFAEFIAFAFILMACGTFLVGACCLTVLLWVLALLKKVGKQLNDGEEQEKAHALGHEPMESV